MKKLLLILPLFFSSAAFAFPDETGHVIYFQVHQNPTDNSVNGQRYIVKLDSEISSNQCGADIWTGTLDTEGGKAIYSAILSASISRKEIKLNGTSETTCLAGHMLIRNVHFIY
ncbi:MAG: hypothetical protein GY821_07030 [Gammaproteobacteria bacterium]|nr:hypothetical protein [Gammaproteobacteria bacterium]